MRFLFSAPSLPRPEDTLPGRPDPVLPDPGIHAVTGRRLAPPYPDGFEIAEFALGCFWGEEQLFWNVPGVWVTAVGYQGGTTPNATYQEVCSGRTGHAESVRVVFDPALVSYDALLRAFWAAHDPTQGFRQGNDVGTQYRSAIFTHSPAQYEAAIATRAAFQAELSKAGFGAITTEIAPAASNPFFFAEAYHQQYLHKNPHGYCPNHATGVTLPDGFAITPLQIVD